MTQVVQLLQSAIGYLQLGMLQEANEEIEVLPPEPKTDKNVLGVRAMIYLESGEWQLLREVSGLLVQTSPEDSRHWIWLAYATRRCRTIGEAQGILLKALMLHVSEPMIHFNLACYTAQTDDLATARERLSHAILLDPGTKQLALEDPDLMPLWDEIGKSTPALDP